MYCIYILYIHIYIYIYNKENEKYVIFRTLDVEIIEQLICNNTAFLQKALCSVLHSYRAIIRRRLMSDMYVWRESDENLRQRIFLKRGETQCNDLWKNVVLLHIYLSIDMDFSLERLVFLYLSGCQTYIGFFT